METASKPLPDRHQNTAVEPRDRVTLLALGLVQERGGWAPSPQYPEGEWALDWSL